MSVANDRMTSWLHVAPWLALIGVAGCAAGVERPLASLVQSCHEVTVCHTETVCTVPTCRVVSDGHSVATVNAQGLSYTGNVSADIVTVAVTKTSGPYSGWTAYGSIVPAADGTGSVTFRLGTGAGTYSVALIGSAFGKVPCATFTWL